MFRILIFLKAFEQQMMSNCFIRTYPALIVQLLITFAGKIVVDFSQIYTSFFFSWYQYNTKENSEKNNYPCSMRNSVLQIQNMFCFLILNYYCVILTLQYYLNNLFIFNTKWNSYSIHNIFWLHLCRKVIWIKIYIVKNEK